METAEILERAKLESWADEEVVRRVLEGETALYEIIMRRYNQRLYRAARAILRDDGEAEDVLQDTYVRAYQHLAQFAGRAKFSTWLTRIAVHEALARVAKRRRVEQIDAQDQGMGALMLESKMPDPESQVARSEVARLLEEAILALPKSYRTVLMLRDVEEMSTAEAAEALEMTEENVKVRLHRARALLRKELYARAGATTSAAFQFMATRCDRVVKEVFRRIAVQ
ncbi:MAG: RNA polymerase sigma factor [Terriglobales bacterium]